MTSNGKSHVRCDTLIAIAIEAFDLLGCPYCGSPPEHHSFPVGKDRLDQVIACCPGCADDHIVFHFDECFPRSYFQVSEWSLHDREFFELHPERKLHIRRPWRREAEILTFYGARPDGHVPCNTVLVASLAPRIRVRTLLPFLSPVEFDAAGDDSIAIQLVEDVSELLANARSEWQSDTEGACRWRE